MVALQGPAAREILRPLCRRDGPRRASASTGSGSAAFVGAGSSSAPRGTPGSPAARCCSRPVTASASGPPSWKAGGPRAASPAALARGTRCGRRRASPCTATRSTRPRTPSARAWSAPRCAWKATSSSASRRWPLLARPPSQAILVGFEMTEPGVPRHGYDIQRPAAGRSARVTTRAFQPAHGTLPRHGLRGQPLSRRSAARCRSSSGNRHKAARIVEAAVLHIAPLEVRHGVQGSTEKARYSKTHEWVRVEGGEAVIGISDYAQDKLSDVVFVELPGRGQGAEGGDARAWSSSP